MKSIYHQNITQDIVFYSIVLFGFGWLISTYQILLGPIIISCVIAYLLFPVVTWISNRIKIDRRNIVPVVYLAFLSILVLTITFVLPIVASQFSLLISQLNKLPDQIVVFQSSIEEVSGFKIPIESFFDEFESDMAQLLQPEQLFRIIQGTSTNIVWIIIIVITSFHLLRDWERLREWLFDLSPLHLRTDVRRLHEEIKAIWQAYLRGQLLIMFILAVLSGIGAAMIGLPGSMILGFLAGALALIPSLGPAIATGIAVVIALTQGSTYLDLSNLAVAVIVIIIFQGIQLIEGLWLTPRIIGRRLNLHPGLVLITIVSTLFTLGALIALISVPLLGSLDLLVKFIRQKRARQDPWSYKGTIDFPGKESLLKDK